MKLVSFRRDGATGWGVLKGDGIVDMTKRLGARCPTLKSALAANALGEVAAAAGGASADVARSAVELDLPIPDPDKVFCVGQNYVAHIKEMGHSLPEFPSIFMRAVSSFSRPGEAILRPIASECFDYENELTAVIGTRCRHVAETDALGVIAGYTIMNEGSVRDWQRMGPQVTPGKNFYRSGSIGPCMTTADEIPDPSALTLETRVNGDRRQYSGTDDMVFSVQRLVHLISTFTWLEPGDMISTGSSSGVAAGFKPPKWLKAGDVVEMEMKEIGVLRNEVADEPR